MNMYDTYIFDLDGTLLSTLNDLAASCNYALEHNGMPQRSIDEVRQFVGNGVKKLMERAIPDGLNNPLFDKTYHVLSPLKHNTRKSIPMTTPPTMPAACDHVFQISSFFVYLIIIVLSRNQVVFFQR